MKNALKILNIKKLGFLVVVINNQNLNVEFLLMEI